MTRTLDNPLDPNEFGNLFAELLSIISDDHEVDCVFGPYTFDGLLTVGGTDYRVRITPAALPEDDR